jgi:hypothetical protein
MATERDRNDSNGSGLDGQIVATHLPYLRRYARALTGAQDAGDRYAIATLEAIIADPSTMDGHDSPKTGLFAVFHRIWSSSGAVVEDADAPDSLLEQRAQWRLQGLSPNSREALLLNTIEGFAWTPSVRSSTFRAPRPSELLERAREEMGKMVTGDVLIIEDEAIIAMDLEAIVGGMGHKVVGIARTRAGASQAGDETFGPT